MLRPQDRPLTATAEPRSEANSMSKRIEVKDLNVYYGDFLAVEGVTMTIDARSVTAFIGPSGCGKSTFLRTLNRMHEVIPGARVEGEVLLDGDNLYGPGVDPVAVRRQVGMVFQRPNPFPTMSIRDNVLAGVKLNNKQISKGEADDAGREVAAAARTSGTRSRTASTSPAPACPAASSSACASPARSPCQPAGAADGRAVLGARPDLDAARSRTSSTSSRTSTRSSS